MELSPQTIRSTGFKTVKKGYDPDEVELFRNQVAAAVESAQNQATAMEARARAAVAKLQEVSQQAAEGSREPVVAASKSGDTEVISRTLLLAQRTADTAVSEARAEADAITAHAREEAARVLDSARSMASKTVDDSRLEARRAVEDERVRAENEVQSLLARRDFLLGDVDHLEQYLQAQRERLRDAAVQLQELVDRVPGGLGDMRRPLLSASANALADEPRPVSSLPSAEPPAAAGGGDEPLQAVDDITAEVPVAESTVVVDAPGEDLRSDDRDTAPLFTSSPDRAAGLSALALSGDPSAQDSVWRLLDEEVASTQAAQASLALDEVTAEVPLTPSQQAQEPFNIGGDELR
ncbi:MAG: DivIVA domain-containing protein [Ilumatobacteraceae bacterium]